MSTVKRLARFLPSPPPQNIPIELQEWLREEFERITLAANGGLELADELRSAPRMFLAGTADDFTLNTTDSPIVNYSQQAAIGEVPIEPDAATGTITVPITGLYNVTAYVYGLQPSNTQNETIRLLVEADGVPVVVAAVDVATNQTDDRVLIASLTRSLPAGTVLRQLMDATGNMGTFEVQSTTFEVTIVTAANAEGVAQAATANLAWTP